VQQLAVQRLGHDDRIDPLDRPTGVPADIL
jgi:hypothetical protein